MTKKELEDKFGELCEEYMCDNNLRECYFDVDISISEDWVSVCVDTYDEKKI